MLREGTCTYMHMKAGSLHDIFQGYTDLNIYSLAPSGPFDVAHTIFKPYEYLCMHDAQEHVAVRYIPARSCLC